MQKFEGEADFIEDNVLLSGSLGRNVRSKTFLPVWV